MTDETERERPPRGGGRRRGPGPGGRGPGPGGRHRGDWMFAAERRGRPTTTETDREEVRSWLVGHLVDGWFVEAPNVVIDDYEILITGTLPAIEDAQATNAPVAEQARIDRFREDSRERRIEIAALAEQRFSRKVSWGVSVGSTKELFTTASVPVMTRLRMQQRQTLDTLVDAGVARSRSDALAWCVELVGRNEQEWIERLRSALNAVEDARAEGPGSSQS